MEKTIIVPVAWFETLLKRAKKADELRNETSFAILMGHISSADTLIKIKCK